jgi:hypothetical protein
VVQKRKGLEAEFAKSSRIEPVLEAIVATAAHLCKAQYALAYLRHGRAICSAVLPRLPV